MGKVMQLAVYRNFEEFECWVCGVPFALSEQHAAALRRDEKGFKCPNGCALRFGESDETRLRRELAEKDRQLAYERERAATNFKAREKAEREAARLKKRISGGACPCCNRSFQNLTRHMKTKHPDFAATT